MAFIIKSNGTLTRYTEEKGVTDVVIPNSVTSIGEWAFQRRSSIKNVTIPDSVTSIGTNAFSCCENLTSITIPDNVTSIGGNAFFYCRSLTSITIPNSVTSIGDQTFDLCSNLTSVTMPYGVISIGKYAFQGCESLTSITIPNSVTSIGTSAFRGCKSLTSITIPDSVTTIGGEAFDGCKSLTSITIPDSVTSIGDWAFPKGIKITIYKCNIEASFTLKEKWNQNKSEQVLNNFICASIEERPQYFSDLKPCYKLPLALFMVSAYPQEKCYPDYLKRSAKKAGMYLIDEENIELLYKFLELGFVTEKNIDDLINHAIEHTQNGGSPEPQVILSDYKNTNFGTQGTDSFDKYFI